MSAPLVLDYCPRRIPQQPFGIARPRESRQREAVTGERDGVRTGARRLEELVAAGIALQQFVPPQLVAMR